MLPSLLHPPPSRQALGTVVAAAPSLFLRLPPLLPTPLRPQSALPPLQALGAAVVTALAVNAALTTSSAPRRPCPLPTPLPSLRALDAAAAARARCLRACGLSCRHRECQVLLSPPRSLLSSRPCRLYAMPPSFASAAICLVLSLPLAPATSAVACRHVRRPARQATSGAGRRKC